MNGLLGVYGHTDPAGALERAGVRPAWSGRWVAFGGAPVGCDSTGSIIVCGDALLDNLAALRRALERPEGSHQDLLAELYVCHGPRMGLHALGMYAVAVWDIRRERLTLVRDGVGARTLYHAGDERDFWFAARLRTLRRTPAVSDALSLPALRDYLCCAYVPGGETLWRDAGELRPGSSLELPDRVEQAWWTPRETAGSDEPMEAYTARLRPLLEDSVEACLPERGPVSVLLSGGLDSSLVTALAAQRAVGPVHTFATHFGAEYPNELEFSSLVARHCDTRHHVLELPGRRIRDALAETMAALDDPIGDPLTVPNLLLARAARQESEVVLNGEGGDPCFGGPKNLPMLLHELYGAGKSRAQAYLRAYQKCHDDLHRLLTPDASRELAGAPPAERHFELLDQETDGPSYLGRLMTLNTVYKGADHILTKVSNLTSAAGLLGRSPLFDRRVVEASFAIPPEHKLAGTVEKAVLKRAVADLLPEAILNRPKSGMLVPVQAWFRRDLRRYARSMLLARGARTRPYFNREVIREWLDYQGSPWPRHGVKLWLVLSLEVWLREKG